MASSVKKSIRKVIPVRASVFEKYKEEQRRSNQEMLKRLDSLITQNAELQKKLQNAISKNNREMGKRIESLHKDNDSLHRELESVRKAIEDTRKTVNCARTDIDGVRGSIGEARKRIELVGNISREANWSNVFHDTITASTWFSDIPLSPGRWAVGYQYLYVLYRVLDGFQPRNIIDFGLGESTTVINAYARTHGNVSHTVIEHDSTWIEFYTSKNEVSGATEILQCDLELTRIPEVSHEIRVYQDYIQELEKRYPNRTYDFVSIDGPFGYDMPEAARIDVLSLIPERLAESFVIMIDDYNRSGEKGTVELIKARLEEASIEYATGIYQGEKAASIIVSKNLEFLCTM